jgi:membrane-bound lytic murein transglycosylase D
MTYTAPEYNLTRNGYFDYRFDPEKSTRAYAKYIKRLYGLFGDWYLAMAAYDWGPGYIQRAVQRTGYADFWELYRRNAMPAETRAYVPQILAAIIMAKNPEKYGLNQLVPSPPVIYDTVSTSYAISVALVADLTGSNTEEIAALNPALLRTTTPPDIPYDLHIPPGTRDAFLERLKDIPENDRATWRFHVVKAGETMESIAASLHTNATLVAQVNQVSATNPIQTGDELVIPIAAAAREASVGQQRYTLRRGDSLVTVADRFDVTVEQLRAWNGLRAGRVTPGRTIWVAEPVRVARAGRGGRGRSGAHAASTRGARAASPGAHARGTHAAAAASRGAAHGSAHGASHAAAAPSRSAAHASGKHKR